MGALDMSSTLNLPVAGIVTLLSDRTDDTVPNLVFQRDQRWRRYSNRRLCSPDAIHGQTGNVNLPIRIIWITLAVSAEQRGTPSGNVEEALNHARFLQILHQEITFGINVWRDVMGYLTGVMAQADSAIEGY